MAAKKKPARKPASKPAAKPKRKTVRKATAIEKPKLRPPRPTVVVKRGTDPNPAARGSPFQEDCLVAVLRRKEAIGRTRVVAGYLAQPRDGKLLLYTSPALDEGIAFERDAVVHMVVVVTSPDPDLDIGGRLVWLRKDAPVRYVGPRSGDEEAAFLRGLFIHEATPVNSVIGGTTVMAPTGTHIDCW